LKTKNPKSDKSLKKDNYEKHSSDKENLEENSIKNENSESDESPSEAKETPAIIKEEVEPKKELDSSTKILQTKDSQTTTNLLAVRPQFNVVVKKKER